MTVTTTAPRPPAPVLDGLPLDHPVPDAGVDGSRPNVLVICMDQMRGDWLGAAGHPAVRTPQMDKLCQQGRRYARALSECPVCVPARRILMTGRSPWGIDMYGNVDTQPFPQGPKIAELLTAAGYQSFAAGKLHTWPPRARLGFEDVQLNEEGRTAGLSLCDDYEQFLRQRGEGMRAYSHGLGNNQYGCRVTPLAEEATATGWTADHALRFLHRRDPQRPFFLYVSFDKPHPPLTPLRDYLDLYRETRFPAPVMGSWLEAGVPRHIADGRAAFQWDILRSRPDEIQESLRAYAALITHIDSRIGQIIGTLRERGVLNNTLIALVADHGDQLFDHGAFAKGDFLTGSCHIPYVIVPPLRQRAPALTGVPVTSHAVGLADLAPTILDWCGVRAPEGMEGASLRPFHQDGPVTFRARTVGRCGGHYVIQDGHWRLTWNAEDGRVLLFDLDADPLCTTDRSGASATVAAELRAHLDAAMAAHRDERVVAGRLSPSPRPPLVAPHAKNHWNNRGWR
jgi:arylsulfatase